ncbi:MAG TPA: 1-acyl-sn-glycerol-3-phosphate acyltransferase [Burkholderiaceae bacterium]|nr:1-acyl-sn-glycerol-3-phosphate acyltransferase [Burkholderiaceae bacterium]
MSALLPAPSAAPHSAVPHLPATSADAALDQLRPVRFRGSRIARTILRLFGWRTCFDGVPGPHGVIIVYPHTSNWDFLVGILAKWALGIPVRWWGKDSLFVHPLTRYTLGPLMRWWGGVPVNRAASQGLIASTVQQMKSSPFFWLALAPEGTRSLKPYWKSGFYHLAVAAKVPLGLAALDFARKEVRVTQFIGLTGDPEQDLPRIRAYYASATGCRPAQAGPIHFRPAEGPHDRSTGVSADAATPVDAPAGAAKT